jgi:PAS domain S-box-containing protein
MKHTPASPELKITILYIAIGGSWILLSDKLAAWLFTNTLHLTIVQTYKGWFYIIFTACLFYYLIRKSRRSQENLKQDYADIFKSAEEGIFRSSPDGGFILLNPAMARIYGYDSPEEMIETVQDINTQIHLYPESRERFKNMLREHGRVQYFEAQNVTRDKTVIWTSTNAHEVRDEKGNTKYYEGFVTDITRQKKAEMALRDAELLYRTLIEEMPAAVYTGNADNYENYFTSSQAEVITGYTDEEWKNDPRLLMHITHPDDLPGVKAESERAIQSGTPFDMEYRILAKNGEIVWVHDVASLIHDEHGKPQSWQGLLIDITNQKNAEETNRLREARYHMLVEYASDGIFITDSQGNLLEINQQAGNMLGYEKNELLSKNLLDLMPREETALRPLKLQELQSGRMIKIERTFLQKNGGYISVELNSKRLPDGNLINIARDISHRRLLQESLIRSEKRFRALIENSMDVIALFSPEGKVIYQSPSSVSILGYSLDEVIGRNAFSIVVEEDRDDIQKAFHALLRAAGNTLKMELRCFHKDGSIRWLDVMATNHLNEPGIEAVVVNYNDVTARKNADSILERQLAELSILHSMARVETDAKSVDELIESATQIISNMLHPDNCGVLLLNKQRDLLQPHPSYFGTGTENLKCSTPVDMGICGHVVQTGRTIRVNKTSENDLYIPSSEGIHSELCVPIFVSSKIIGVLNIESITEDAYTEADERLLNTIAGGLASAIERLQLFEHEQKLYEQAEVLREATASLTESLEIQIIYEKILSVSARLVAYTSASIELINGRYAELVAQRGLPEGFDYLGKPYELEPGKWNQDIWAPVVIADVQMDARFIKFPHTQYIHSWMGIPLIAREKMIGFLNFDNERVDFFTKEDAALLQTFANQAAVAIENARLFEAEQQRRRDADILREATIALTANMTLEQTYQIALNSLAKLIPHDHATLELIRENSHGHEYTHEIVATRNFKKNAVGEKFVINYDEWGGIDGVKRPLIVNDLPADERFKQFNGLEGSLSWMGIPLIVQDRLIGYLSLDSKNPSYFSEERMAIAQTLANQVATAIENTRLFESEKRRRRDAEILSQATASLTNSMEINNLLEIIMDWLYKIAPYDSVSITLGKDGNFEIAASRGLPTHTDFSKISFPINEKWTQIANTHQPLQIHDAREDARFEKLEGTEYIRGWMGVPMFTQNALIGFINLDSRTPGAFNNQEQAAAVQIFANQAATAIDKTRLLENLQHSNQELYLAYDNTLEGWGKALELRDKETQGHTQRVTDLTLKLARQMGISEAELIHVRRGVLMHDIGKMGVPDSILHKTGPLTVSEMDEMKKHTQYAYDLIHPIAYLRPAIDIAYYHHEWWDGNGYPHMLKGEEIPLSARIFAIIDVWDALLSDRPYRKAWSRKKVIQYIRDLSGKQFDPHVVTEFFKMIEDGIKPVKKKAVK